MRGSITLLSFLVLIFLHGKLFGQNLAARIDSLELVVADGELEDSLRIVTQKRILHLLKNKPDTMRFDQEVNYAKLINSLQRKDESIRYGDSIAEIYKGKVDDERYFDLKEMTAFWVKENGEGEESMKRLFELLKIYESRHKYDRAAELSRKIGVFFLKVDDYPNAIYYLKNGIDYSDKAHDTHLKSNCYMSLGNVYKDQKRFEEAERSYEESIRLAKKNNDVAVLAGVYNNIGSLYRMVGKSDKAYSYYLKAVEMNNKSGNRRWLSYNYNNIGNYFLEKKDYNKALDYFLRSKSIKEEIQDDEGLVLTLLNISITYEDLGDINNAYKYHKSFYNLKDSLDGVRQRTESRELSAKFQAEQRESEIRSLNIKTEMDQKLLKAKDERIGFQKWINSLLIAGVFLLLLLVFFVWRNVVTKKKVNAELAHKNEVINEKNKQIIDSINYASDIQKGILAPQDIIEKILPTAAVRLLPRDIVSGDFYLIEEVPAGIFFGTVDCTGHGVPGAMVSLVAFQAFQKMIYERKISDPGELLSRLSVELPRMLQQARRDGKTDGLDCAIAFLDSKDRNQLYYSGAKQSCWIFREGEHLEKEVVELKSNRNGIGDAPHEFDTIQFTLQDGDTVVLMSDGLADQFGGELNKKFGYKRFKELMACLSGDHTDQMRELENTWNDWKGENEQVDDVCVFIYQHKTGHTEDGLTEI